MDGKTLILEPHNGLVTQFTGAIEEFAELTTADLRAFGRTLLVAPHPDDETLGGGGLLALLSHLRCPVQVIAVSDGTQSHPHSTKFPAARLRAVRAAEMLQALEILGVPANRTEFWELPDGAVPENGTAGFAAAVARAGEFLQRHEITTLILPWRRDTHRDHRAVWEIFTTARRLSNHSLKVFEYPLWLWARGLAADAPHLSEVRPRRLNIRSKLARKRLAIQAHLTQVSALIDDDPTGFRLTPEMLAHFMQDWEVFLEVPEDGQTT